MYFSAVIQELVLTHAINLNPVIILKRKLCKLEIGQTAWKLPRDFPLFKSQIISRKSKAVTSGLSQKDFLLLLNYNALLRILL